MTTGDEAWLTTAWPLVRAHLPPPPGRVLEIGCGPIGGFVPALLVEAYDALGIDPQAPPGAAYTRSTFEESAATNGVAAFVASTSLHHVQSLDRVLDRVAAALAPGGVVIVLEWAWERFDESTAQWCFDRLPADGGVASPGWLHDHRRQWSESGRPWDEYLSTWARGHGLHPGAAMLSALDTRFRRTSLDDVAYFFSELPETTAEEEARAVVAGQLRPSAFRYVGTV